MHKLKDFRKALLLLLIFLLGINGAVKLHASEVEYKRYDRQEMGVFYKEAEKYKEEIKWEEVVNRGREIVKSQWEMRMWEELAREFKAEDITEEEIDQIIKENEIEWEAEANADLLLEKGRWKAGQYREEIQEEIKNDEEIAEFRRWCEQVEEDIEGMDLRAGLEEWAEHLRNITTSKNEKREAVRRLIEEKIEEELSAITDDDKRAKYEKGFREEIERIAKEFERRWEWEADATWVRKRNIWMMEKTRDQSMRQEYENKRASVVAERIIGETKERADKSIEESLAEEAEKEDWEQKKEYRHYEKVIGEGLAEWNKALESFYRNWSIWREEAGEQFEEGQREWEKGYELIKNEREAWLLRTEERIRQGLREWQDKWEEVEKEREEAEQELTRYIQIQKESWNNHIAGIEDVLVSGSKILKQAEDNISWLDDKKQQYWNEWREVEGTYNYWKAKYDEIERLLEEKNYEEKNKAYNEGSRSIELYTIEEVRDSEDEIIGYTNVLTGIISFSGVNSNYKQETIFGWPIITFLKALDGNQIIYSNLSSGEKYTAEGINVTKNDSEIIIDFYIKNFFGEWSKNNTLQYDSINAADLLKYNNEIYDRDEAIATINECKKDVKDRDYAKTRMDELYEHYERYEYYENEYQNWINIRDEINSLSQKSESIYHDDDMWGGINGIFVNSSDNPADMYYMTESEFALEKLQAEKEYWSRRLEIAEAVKEYALGSGTTREKKEESETRLEQTRHQMEIEVSNYKAAMAQLNNVAKASMENKQALMQVKLNEMEIAKLNFDNSVKSYEQARIVMIALENDNVREKLQKDLNLAYEEMSAVEERISDTLKAYNEEIRNYIAAESAKNMADAIYMRIEEVEEYKEAYQTVEGIISAHEGNENWEIITGNEMIDNAEKIWEEEEREDKVNSINEKLEKITGAVNDVEKTIARVDLIQWIKAEQGRLENGFKEAEAKYEYMIGNINKEAILEQNDGADIEYIKKIVQENFTLAKNIEQIAKQIDISEIEDSTAYIEAVTSIIKDKVENEYEVVKGVLAYFEDEDTKTAINAILIPDGKKDERYALYKANLEMQKIVASSLDAVYQDYDLTNDDEREALLYILIEAEDDPLTEINEKEVNAQVSSYILNESEELFYEAYIVNKDYLKNKKAGKNRIIEYVKQSDRSYREDIENLQQIFTSIGISEEYNWSGENAAKVMEQAEKVLVSVNYLIENEIATEIIQEIQNKIEDRLYQYRLAEYIAYNKDTSIEDLELEKAVLTNAIRGMEKDIAMIQNILSEVYNEKGDEERILRFINEVEYKNRAGDDVEGLIEQLEAGIKQKKIYAAVDNYKKNFKALSPEDYVIELEGFTEDEKENIKEQVKPWYVINRYENDRILIISDKSLTEWINGEMEELDIDDKYRDELKAEILYREFCILHNDYYNGEEIENINNYSEDVQSYIGYLLARDFYLEFQGNYEGIEGNEETIVRDFIGSRSDLEEDDETVSEFVDYLKNWQENKDPLTYLDKEVQIREWKSRYFETVGSTAGYLRKEEEIDAYIDEMDVFGAGNDVKTEVRKYIRKIADIRGCQEWGRMQWYIEEKGLNEEEGNELRLFTKGIIKIIEPDYGAGLYEYLNMEVLHDENMKIAEEMAENLKEDFKPMNIAIGKTIEKKTIIEECIKDREIDHLRNWREFLDQVDGEEMPDIKHGNKILYDDKEDGAYYTEGGREIQEARDKLGDLVESIQESVGALKQYKGLMDKLSHVREEIKADYYTIESGYNSENDFREYINNKNSEYISAIVNKNDAHSTYQGERSIIQGYREDIARNGGVIKEYKNASGDYEATLKERSQSVEDMKGLYNSKREGYEEAETGFREMQGEYINTLKQVKNTGTDMDEARMEYEIALGKYEWAVSEYMYEQSSEASETDESSSVENKRDPVDEYNRINNIYTDLIQRIEEKQEEVDEVVRYEEIMEDEEVKKMVSEYNGLMESFTRVGKAEVEVEKLIADYNKLFYDALDDYEDSKNEFYSLPSNTDGAKGLRDDIIRQIIDEGFCNEAWMRDVGTQLKGVMLTANWKNIYIPTGGFTEGIYNFTTDQENAYTRIGVIQNVILHARNALRNIDLIYGYFNAAGEIWLSNPMAYISKFFECVENGMKSVDSANREGESYQRIANSYTSMKNKIRNNRANIRNKRARLFKYIGSSDVNHIKSLLKGTYGFLKQEDMDYLVEGSSEEEFSYNITNLKKPVELQKTDYDKNGNHITTNMGYNTYTVLKGLRTHLDNEAERKMREIEKYAQEKGYSIVEIQKMKEVILRELQQFAVGMGRDTTGYAEISKKILSIGNEVYSQALQQEEELQGFKWDLKEKGFLDEQAKWNDTMTLIKERGSKQWSQMQSEYINMWRGWYLSTKRAIREKEEEYIKAEKEMRNDRDRWMKDVIVKGINYRKDELHEMIMNTTKKAEEIVKGSAVVKKINGEMIAQDIIEDMRPEEVSQEFIQAARGMDMNFSIEKVRDMEYNNSTASRFRSRLEYYTKEMEKVGKLKLLEQMKEQLDEMEEAYEKSLKEQDDSASESFKDMFSEKGFSIEPAAYKREVIEESTLFGGDEYKGQNIRSYFGIGVDISYDFISIGDVEKISSYEIELYTKIAMDSIQESFENRQEALAKHIGEAPIFNDKGDVTKNGTGESHRLIIELVDAEKEKSAGEAKANAPFYSKGMFPGLNISLSSVVKIGLSFIPGGQLAALAMSVSETAYGYATGAIQGLGGLLNVATSAVGAGFDALGNIAKSAFSAAKTVGKVVGTVAKNVVKGVGSFINKGFKAKRNGSLDWSMSSKEAKNFTTDVAWEFGGNMAGDLTSDFIIGHDKDKLTGKEIDKKLNIGKGVSLNNLASSFANEGFQFMRKDAEFRMNVISMGAIQDYVIGKQSMQFGNGQSFMSKFGSSFAQNLYNSDADISKFRSTGYGVNISKKGKFTETHTVSGGFDLSELTIASLHDPAGLGRNVFNAAKGIALGISSGVAATYNLFDRGPEQKEHRNNNPYDSTKTDPVSKTPMATEEQLNSNAKKKKALLENFKKTTNKEKGKGKHRDKILEQINQEIRNAENAEDDETFWQAVKRIGKELFGVKDLYGKGADKNTKGGEYKVKAGDTLLQIAKKFNTSIDKLIKHNPELEENPDHIKTGQKINLKGKTTIKTVAEAIYNGIKEVGLFQWKVKAKVNNFLSNLFKSKNSSSNNNLYGNISITSEEKKLIIGAVISESSSIHYEKEKAGIAAVLLNRVLTKHAGYDNVKDIVLKTGIYGVTGNNGKGNAIYQYYANTINWNSTEALELIGNPSKKDLLASINYSKGVLNKKIKTSTQILNSLINGNISDPTKGAIFWGSVSDYSNRGGIFKQARERKRKGLRRFGNTYFFK